MKKGLVFVAFALSFSMFAQQKPSKQYRSAETGKYVTKKEATKSPKTTYSTDRKTSSKKSKN
ncbi:hypothetical protein ABH942_002663 [Flavobacterium sp. 28YEA47A]|uniref:hypothetical protein n=1 Tax=Flavobacterium sp. 28YEA47A TaxID=3156276 RepID=UPI0035129025